jgi:hypothetical protein
MKRKNQIHKRTLILKSVKLLNFILMKNCNTSKRYITLKVKSIQH